MKRKRVEQEVTEAAQEDAEEVEEAKRTAGWVNQEAYETPSSTPSAFIGPEGRPSGAPMTPAEDRAWARDQRRREAEAAGETQRLTHELLVLTERIAKELRATRQAVQALGNTGLRTALALEYIAETTRQNQEANERERREEAAAAAAMEVDEAETGPRGEAEATAEAEPQGEAEGTAESAGKGAGE